MTVATLPTGIRLSAEQKDILSWVKKGSGSATIEAVAGSGKTFTLETIAPHLTGTSAYAVYNKKNSDEAKAKMNHIPGLSIGTCHSFGFAAWRGYVSNVKVSQWDKRRMMHDENEVPQNLQGAVSRLVSLAKQSMGGLIWSLDEISPWISMIEHYDVLWQVEDDGRSQEDVIRDLIDISRRCTAWSHELETIIDFDDMIWLPLLKNVPIRQYDWVLLDEAQDLNVSRRMLAEKMLKSGGRLVAVGDRNQAIYGFTGADADSLDRISAKHKCISLPLSTTYRCSKEATLLAQEFVPHIEAHEKNNTGSVSNISLLEFRSRHMNENEDKRDKLISGDAILCRLTRPLVALAFQLIRSGTGCYVEGRDIGKQLERMATRWKVKSVKALAQNLEGYRQLETSRLLARKARGAIELLDDRIETLHIIMEGCETVAEVVAKIQGLFQDTTGTPNTVVLSTIHKAKGREWDRVFVLGWGAYMPSPWATQEWEKQQERNLMYVAVTRTKSDLILIAEGL